MNPAHNESDQKTQQINDAAQLITNPLLENMGSSPYYVCEYQNQGQNPKPINDSAILTEQVNPYYDSNLGYNPPFEEAPVFQNTPQIQIKQKIKNPQKPKKPKLQKGYAILNENNNRNIQRGVPSNSEPDFINKDCCNQGCFQCLCQVCLMLVCEIMFKR